MRCGIFCKGKARKTAWWTPTSGRKWFWSSGPMGRNPSAQGNPKSANLFIEGFPTGRYSGSPTEDLQCMGEEWDVLVSFFPDARQDLATVKSALKGLRRVKGVEKLLRTLLLHVGCAHSLRETVLRARKAKLAELSDVVLLKRLRKCERLLHSLCFELFSERGVAGLDVRHGRLRLVDASQVRWCRGHGSIRRGPTEPRRKQAQGTNHPHPGRTLVSPDPGPTPRPCVARPPAGCMSDAAQSRTMPPPEGTRGRPACAVSHAQSPHAPVGRRRRSRGR